MTTTEAERLALHAAARDRLGTGEGDTLMGLLPPANTEIATRRDLDVLEARLRTELTTAVAALGRRMFRTALGLGAVFVSALVGTQAATVAILGRMLG